LQTYVTKIELNAENQSDINIIYGDTGSLCRDCSAYRGDTVKKTVTICSQAWIRFETTDRYNSNENKETKAIYKDVSEQHGTCSKLKLKYQYI